MYNFFHFHILKNPSIFRSRFIEDKIRMLYFIGLGLGCPDDITVRGLKYVQKSDKIFLEAYTSIMPNFSISDLETEYGVKGVIVADREMVEHNSDVILNEARGDGTVSFLVVGDPFAATTHCDLFLRAQKAQILAQ
ncbi:hypothetical protein ACOME3_007650 [Neoechinorhynchus agilis]